MKIEIKTDKQKAESLKKMAEITLRRLEEIDKEKYPSNTLTDYYDVIHKLMEAITVAEGVKIKGEGAHQQLIDYIAKEKKMKPKKNLSKKTAHELNALSLKFDSIQSMASCLSISGEKIRSEYEKKGLIPKFSSEAIDIEHLKKSPLCRAWI